jgi:hypothetical protein
MLRTLSIAILAATALTGGAAHAVALTDTYSQNFDTLAASGTSSSVPEGWAFVETGANANGTYAANNGSETAGNTYSYGTTGSTDRAFGTLRSNALVPSITATFTNANATAITALDIDYFGEMWRLGATGRTDRLAFSYSVAGGAFVTAAALDFVSPVTTGTGARNGNLAVNRRAISGSLSGLNILSGQSIVLRWNDLDISGSEDGLAIDDFGLSATVAAPAVVPEPATWAMMIAGFGLVGAGMRRRRVAIVAA